MACPFPGRLANHMRAVYGPSSTPGKVQHLGLLRPSKSHHMRRVCPLHRLPDRPSQFLQRSRLGLLKRARALTVFVELVHFHLSSRT
jgi:hypothetical protein